MGKLPPAIPLDALVKCYKTDPKMTRQKWVLWACECAERVLEIYQNAFPNDHRPREAIAAARRWVADPTLENADTAFAAHATAYDAYANNAAAHAAYAAAYAARTAYAAHAAHAIYAAYAADAAARAATDPEAESLWQAVKLMEIYHA